MSAWGWPGCTTVALATAEEDTTIQKTPFFSNISSFPRRRSDWIWLFPYHPSFLYTLLLSPWKASVRKDCMAMALLSMKSGPAVNTKGSGRVERHFYLTSNPAACLNVYDHVVYI